MSVAGFFLALFGFLLIVGEYLCVEVAWKCVGYGQVIPYVGITCLSIGLIAMLIDVDVKNHEE